MSANNGRRPGRAAWIAVALLVAALVVVLVVRRQRAPHGPRVLNQRTPAREVRPLVPGPDARVDPLPIEREKHDK